MKCRVYIIDIVCVLVWIYVIDPNQLPEGMIWSAVP